jgi:hypothetical protein
VTILAPALSVDTASAACCGCAARDCDTCNAGGCGDCGRCATVTHFRCDPYRCSWVPDFGSCVRCYGCSACGPQ